MSTYLNGSTSHVFKTNLVTSAQVPYTLSCWVNPDSQTSAANRGVIRLGDTAAVASNRDCVRLFLATTGALSAQAADSAGANASTTTDLVKANQWNHCLGIFPANNSRTAYLNGLPATTNTNARTMSTTATGLAVGASVYDVIDNYLAGYVAHAAIWDVSLTAEEIRELAYGENPLNVRPNSLRYYCPLTPPYSAPSETIEVDYFLSNIAKMPYLTSSVEIKQKYYDSIKSNNDVLISQRTKINSVLNFISEPAIISTSIPVLYRQRQQQGMAA